MTVVAVVVTVDLRKQNNIAGIYILEIITVGVIL